MASILVVLFWIWCGISIVILISRPFYRRAKAGSRVETAPSFLAAGPSAPADHRPPGEDPDGPHGATDEPTRPTSDQELVEAMATAPTSPTGSLGSSTEPRPEGTPPPAGPAASLGSGPDPRPDSTSPPVAPSVSLGVASGASLHHLRSQGVAGVLSGIRMPCDLAPLMGVGTMDPGHVVFATEGHAAEVVGERVGDELERIGCRLTPIDSTTLRAERESGTVEVRIHPDAGQAMDGNAPRFPTASPGSVVVEFRAR